MTTTPSIEPLEARIAPAVVIANPTTATYTDVDGDAVTMKVSKGTLTAGQFFTVASGLGDQLQLVDFSGSGGIFDGANVIFTVKKSTTGDGLVNVGGIQSLNHDLGNLTIPGDLGAITAGDGDPAVAALKTLSVRSMGRYGVATQGAGAGLVSSFNGAVGALVVKGDVVGSHFFVNDAADGTIGSVTIGGDLRGGATTNSGQIFASGNIGPVKVGGHILGGQGLSSGKIQSLGKIASVTVGGSIVGDAGDDSGQILSTLATGAVKIGGDLRGGTGVRSGLVESLSTLASITVGGSVLGGKDNLAGAISATGGLGPVVVGGDLKGDSGASSGSIIAAAGKIASVTIGGSVIGGSDFETGEIKSGGDMGPVKIGGDLRAGTSGISGIIEAPAGNIASVTIGGSVIGGAASSTGKIVANDGTIGAVKIGRDLVGGSVTGADTANGTGYIQGQRILSVTVGGSIIAGTDTSVGTLTQSGSIRAEEDLGFISVKGGLIGNVTTDVVISARGKAVPTATTDLAIASITVGGRVENAKILAGFDIDLNEINGDAQIGTIKVGGDWIASSVSAGVGDGGDGFGNANDTLIPGSGAIVARIAAIQIGGIVIGTGVAGDRFGFVSQQIGSFKSLGFSAPLTGAPLDVIQLPLVTADVTIREVA